MKHKTVAMLVVLGVILMSGIGIAQWTWTEVWHANGTRTNGITSHGNANDQSFSYIATTEPNIQEVEIIIWGNEGPVHYHYVERPNTSQVYLRWETQAGDRYEHATEMNVSGGEYGDVSKYVTTHLEYPYD